MGLLASAHTERLAAPAAHGDKHSLKTSNEIPVSSLNVGDNVPDGMQ